MIASGSSEDYDNVAFDYPTLGAPVFNVQTSATPVYLLFSHIEFHHKTSNAASAFVNVANAQAVVNITSCIITALILGVVESSASPFAVLTAGQLLLSGTTFKNLSTVGSLIDVSGASVLTVRDVNVTTVQTVTTAHGGNFLYCHGTSKLANITLDFLLAYANSFSSTTLSGGLLYVSNAASFRLRNSTFQGGGNSFTTRMVNGSVLFLEKCDNATVTGSLFTLHVASDSGGAIYFGTDATFHVVVRNVFQQCVAANYGGAIASNSNQQGELRSFVFEGNTAGDGKGNDYADVFIRTTNPFVYYHDYVSNISSSSSNIQFYAVSVESSGTDLDCMFLGACKKDTIYVSPTGQNITGCGGTPSFACSVNFTMSSNTLILNNADEEFSSQILLAPGTYTFVVPLMGNLSASDLSVNGPYSLRITGPTDGQAIFNVPVITAAFVYTHDASTVYFSHITFHFTAATTSNLFYGVWCERVFIRQCVFTQIGTGFSLNTPVFFLSLTCNPTLYGWFELTDCVFSDFQLQNSLIYVNRTYNGTGGSSSYVNVTRCRFENIKDTGTTSNALVINAIPFTKTGGIHPISMVIHLCNFTGCTTSSSSTPSAGLISLYGPFGVKMGGISLHFTNCSVTNCALSNSAVVLGYMIHPDCQDFKFDGNQFENLTLAAGNGAALSVICAPINSTAESVLTLSHCEFKNCSAVKGGAIYTNNSFGFVDCKFSLNMHTELGANNGHDILANSAAYPLFLKANFDITTCTDSDRPGISSEAGSVADDIDLKFFKPCTFPDYFISNSGSDGVGCNLISSACRGLNAVLSSDSEVEGMYTANIVGGAYDIASPVAVAAKSLKIQRELSVTNAESTIVKYTGTDTGDVFTISTGSIRLAALTIEYGSATAKGAFVKSTEHGTFWLENVKINGTGSLYSFYEAVHTAAVNISNTTISGYSIGAGSARSFLVFKEGANILFDRLNILNVNTSSTAAVLVEYVAASALTRLSNAGEAADFVLKDTEITNANTSSTADRGLLHLAGSTATTVALTGLYVENVKTLNTGGTNGVAISFITGNTLTLENCFFKGSTGALTGGFLRVGVVAVFSALRCTFESGTVSGTGSIGGAVVFVGSVNSKISRGFIDCTFLTNQAGQGSDIGDSCTYAADNLDLGWARDSFRTCTSTSTGSSVFYITTGSKSPECFVKGDCSDVVYVTGGNANPDYVFCGQTSLDPCHNVSYLLQNPMGSDEKINFMPSPAVSSYHYYTDVDIAFPVEMKASSTLAALKPRVVLWPSSGTSSRAFFTFTTFGTSFSATDVIFIYEPNAGESRTRYLINTANVRSNAITFTRCEFLYERVDKSVPVDPLKCPFLYVPRQSFPYEAKIDFTTCSFKGFSFGDGSTTSFIYRSESAGYDVFLRFFDSTFYNFTSTNGNSLLAMVVRTDFLAGVGANLEWYNSTFDLMTSNYQVANQGVSGTLFYLEGSSYIRFDNSSFSAIKAYNATSGVFHVAMGTLEVSVTNSVFSNIGGVVSGSSPFLGGVFYVKSFGRSRIINAYNTTFENIVASGIGAGVAYLETNTSDTPGTYGLEFTRCQMKNNYGGAANDIYDTTGRDYSGTHIKETCAICSGTQCNPYKLVVVKVPADSSQPTIDKTDLFDILCDYEDVYLDETISTGGSTPADCKFISTACKSITTVLHKSDTTSVSISLIGDYTLITPIVLGTGASQTGSLYLHSYIPAIPSSLLRGVLAPNTVAVQVGSGCALQLEELLLAYDGAYLGVSGASSQAALKNVEVEPLGSGVVTSPLFTLGAGGKISIAQTKFDSLKSSAPLIKLDGSGAVDLILDVVELINSQFTGASAGVGGFIDAPSSVAVSLSIVESTFESITSNSPLIAVANSGSVIRINDNTHFRYFSGPPSTITGGFLYVQAAQSVSIDQVVSRNVGTLSGSGVVKGGAFYFKNVAEYIVIARSEFTNVFASESGGGLYFDEGTMFRLESCQFTICEAVGSNTRGGAIYANSNLNSLNYIIGCSFSSNVATTGIDIYDVGSTARTAYTLESVTGSLSDSARGNAFIVGDISYDCFIIGNINDHFIYGGDQSPACATLEYVFYNYVSKKEGTVDTKMTLSSPSTSLTVDLFVNFTRLTLEGSGTGYERVLNFDNKTIAYEPVNSNSVFTVQNMTFQRSATLQITSSYLSANAPNSKITLSFIFVNVNYLAYTLNTQANHPIYLSNIEYTISDVNVGTTSGSVSAEGALAHVQQNVADGCAITSRHPSIYLGDSRGAFERASFRDLSRGALQIERGSVAFRGAAFSNNVLDGYQSYTNLRHNALFKHVTVTEISSVTSGVSDGGKYVLFFTTESGDLSTFSASDSYSLLMMPKDVAVEVVSAPTYTFINIRGVFIPCTYSVAFYASGELLGTSFPLEVLTNVTALVDVTSLGADAFNQAGTTYSLKFTYEVGTTKVVSNDYTFDPANPYNNNNDDSGGDSKSSKSLSPGAVAGIVVPIVVVVVLAAIGAVIFMYFHFKRKAEEERGKKMADNVELDSRRKSGTAGGSTSMGANSSTRRSGSSEDSPASAGKDESFGEDDDEVSAHEVKVTVSNKAPEYLMEEELEEEIEDGNDFF